MSLTNHVAADPKVKIAVSAADVLRCKLRMYLWASLPGEQHAMAVILALIVLLVISAPAGLCQSNARAVREKSMNTTSTSSPAGYRHAAAAESTLSAAQHTRMRTFTIGLLLPEIRSADVPWLFQTQQAFLMAVRNFNRNLLGADVPWRIRGQLFDEDLLIEHMATQSSMWQNVTSSERSNHTTASCTGTVNVGKRQWSPEYQGCQVLRDNRYSGLLNALDLLQRNDCIAVVAVQSDQLVRVVAPLASPLSVPVVTTNVNRRLHSSYYGSLLRASINDTNLHKAASDIMDALGWHKAVAIYSINNDSSEDPIFSLRMVKITHLIMPASNGCALPNSTKTALNNISRSDVRVIIMHLDTCYYPVILEYAKHIGLIAGEKRFVWIFMDLFNGVRLLPRRFWPWLKGTLILRPSAKSVHMHSDRLALTRFAQMLSNLSVTLDDKKLAGSPALCPSQDISEVSLHAAYVHDIVNTVGQALSSFLADLAADDLDSVLIRKQRSDSRTGVLNLQELCNGTDLLAGIDNASHSSIKENVFAAFDHEYKLEIVSDEEAHTRYLSHWSPSSLSLHREINESRLLEAWDGVLPLPVHLDTVRVIVLPDEPFIFPRNKTSTPTDLDDFIGPVADLWKNVSCLYGMKYNISVWARGENGTNQLLQSKCREKIASWDLVLGAISARPRKKQRCSFSQPYYYDHMAVVILKPADSSLSLGSVWGIFKPFGLYLWLTLVATLFFGAAALVILDPEGLQTARRGNILLDATFFAFSSLLGFGEHNIQQLFGKVFIFCLQFMLCVILASYTASLTNMLSGGTPEGSVRTLEDLTRKTIGYSVGGDSGDWIVDLFETKNKWLVRLEDLKQAEKKLMDRTIDVYFTHSPRAKLMQARNCKLMAVPIRVSWCFAAADCLSSPPRLCSYYSNH